MDYNLREFQNLLTLPENLLKIENMIDKYKKNDNNIAKINNELAQVKKKLDEKKIKYTKLENEVKLLKSTGMGKLSKDLKDIKNELKIKADQLNTMKNDYKKLLDKSSKEKNTADKNEKLLKQDINKKETEIKNLQTDIYETEKENRELVEELDELDELIKIYENEEKLILEYQKILTRIFEKYNKLFNLYQTFNEAEKIVAKKQIEFIQKSLIKKIDKQEDKIKNLMEIEKKIDKLNNIKKGKSSLPTTSQNPTIKDQIKQGIILKKTDDPTKFKPKKIPTIPTKQKLDTEGQKEKIDKYFNEWKGTLPDEGIDFEWILSDEEEQKYGELGLTKSEKNNLEEKRLDFYLAREKIWKKQIYNNIVEKRNNKKLNISDNELLLLKPINLWTDTERLFTKLKGIKEKKIGDWTEEEKNEYKIAYELLISKDYEILQSGGYINKISYKNLINELRIMKYKIKMCKI